MKSYDPSAIEPKWPRRVPLERDHGVNKTYDPSVIEPRWQKKWEEEGLYKAQDFSQKPKYYLLVEFPYPSGERLHVGHGRSYCALDSVARMMRMKGKNVLFPMGWDAFGLPAENYAIKTRIHPSITTRENIEAAKKQIQSWGLSFDWGREINTTDPEYYRWTQWIFLQFFKHGLAYKAEIPVNWCPQDKSNLADEEVVEGCCERCGTKVEKRVQSQWMLAITKYADRLLEDLEEVDYPEHVKEMQRNWIGKSEGAEIEFPLANSEWQMANGKNKKAISHKPYAIRVFTTRLDTIFGATFLVLAPEHPALEGIIKPQIPNSKWKELQDYVRKSMQKSELERSAEVQKKTGVFTGVYAKNPATQENIPVWISDFVLPHYGTGAIMAVPAHDERDFEFAKKFKLPIRAVIEPVGRSASFRDVPKGIDPRESAFIEDGTLVNSGPFSNLDSVSARKKLLDWLGKRGLAKKSITYRLRDWVFSRQHYWGEPIPIIYCRKCWEVKSSKLKVKSVEGEDFIRIEGIEYAVNPVPDQDLPVKLPYVEKYQPTGTGESPLASVKEWVRVKCPRCDSPAGRRETDTMPNWAGSSWYFLRYIDPQNHKQFANRHKLDYWMGPSKKDARRAPRSPELVEGRSGVDWYNGGLEHTTLHLLYSRFWYKFLYDLGLVPGKEPFAKRTSHGVVLGPDGYKMSKSRGNVVNPDEVIAEFGADTFRIYEMFMGPFDQTISWDPRGVLGVSRFLERVWKAHQVITDQEREGRGWKVEGGKTNGEIAGADRASGRGTVGADRVSARDLNRKLHRLIKKVEEDLVSLKFNTAVAAMMGWINQLSVVSYQFSVEDWEIFLRVLAPFAPHLAEELYQRLRAANPKSEARNPKLTGNWKLPPRLVGGSRSAGETGNFESIHLQPWPSYDPTLLVEEEISIPVQVGGRLRGVLKVKSSKSKVQSEIEELAKSDPRAAKYLEGKTIKRVIFVPGKLINFVLENTD